MFEISDLRRREILHLRSVCPTGDVDSGYFWGFKILNFNIFADFKKTEYFWGYEIFVDIFWGSSQNRTIFSLISMHFRVFSEVQGT